jgi:hypothetical protein
VSWSDPLEMMAMELPAIASVTAASTVAPITPPVDFSAAADGDSGISAFVSLLDTRTALATLTPRDVLLGFLEQNLFQSLLDPTALNSDSRLQELLRENNTVGNPATVAQLFGTFDQLSTTGELLNTVV